MSWHYEDATLNYFGAAAGARGVARDRRALRERYRIFDDSGHPPTPAAPTNRGADYLVKIDVGIWEERLDEETWQAWVACKREISR